MLDLQNINESLKDRVGFLAAELLDYQDSKYAIRFIEFVSDTALREEQALGSAGPLTTAAVESMFKLMAYKDEYETARLYLDPEFERSIRSQFGDDAEFKYQLHPPLLRAIGLNRKLSLGQWFKPAFHVLRRCRRLRGTRLDLFGYAEVRKTERALIDEFAALTAEVVPLATEETSADIQGLLGMAQEIRGYEFIKMDSVAEYRRALAEARKSVPAASR